MEELIPFSSCQVFKQIRMDLTYFHNNTKKLNTFKFYSGNADNIKIITKIVLDVLIEHGLIELAKDDKRIIPKPAPGADIDKLRATFMYLIINSTTVPMEFNDELASLNPHCVHLMRHFPERISPMLPLIIALSCGMKQQLNEFFACSPYWLANRYYDIFINILGDLVKDKCECLSIVCAALSSVTKSICYFDVDPEKPIKRQNLTRNAFQLLQRHLLDTEERLSTLRPSLRHRYLGEAMRSLIDVVIEAVLAIRERIKLPGYFNLYGLRAPKISKKIQMIEDDSDAEAKLQYYAGRLLDAVQRVLVNVTIQSFMDWEELPSNHLLMNLQGEISNKAKQLIKLLAEDPVLSKHSIRSQLSNFAEGARTFEQSLEELSLGELLNFLDGDTSGLTKKHLTLGLDQLMKHPIAFGNDECVETMTNHVKLMNAKHANIIFEHLEQVMYVKEDPDDEEYLKDSYSDLLKCVVMQIFKDLPVDEKFKLLVKRDELKLHSYYSFELEGYEPRCIYLFNQLSSDKNRFPHNVFLDLCAEDPNRTWLALAHLAMFNANYACLYYNILVKYAEHAKNHVAYTIQQLMLDGHALEHSPLPRNMDVLLRLYEQPVIFKSMCYRSVRFTRVNCLNRNRRVYQRRKLFFNLSDISPVYTKDQLKAAYDNYLSSLAAGLAKFTETDNLQALRKLANTLKNLHKVEKQLMSKRGVVHGVVGGTNNSRNTALTDSYLKIHDNIPIWRIKHWELTSQVIRSIDKLTGRPNIYDASDILSTLAVYFFKCVPNAILFDSDIRNKIMDLIPSLEYQHMWSKEFLQALRGRNMS